MHEAPNFAELPHSGSDKDFVVLASHSLYKGHIYTKV